MVHYLHQWLGCLDMLYLHLGCEWQQGEMTKGNWCIKWQGCLLQGSQTEEWLNTNLLMFSENKCKVLYPEWATTPYIKRSWGPTVRVATQQKELGDPDGQAEEAAAHPFSYKLLPQRVKISLLSSAISPHPEYQFHHCSSIWDTSTYVTVPWRGY